jgi:Domain of unknown function (DUF6378)
MPKVDEILEERGHRYGDFGDNARVSQGFKHVMLRSNIGQVIPDYQKEALDLIFTKISRIVTGDFTYVDNWDDIAGYATLIANRLREDQKHVTAAKTSE